MLEKFVNTSVFSILFVVSFMMLMFSQIIVIPILMFLFLFVVYLKRFRESFSLEDILFYVFILFSSISILVARNKEVAIGGVLILVLYYIVFYVGRNANIKSDLLFTSVSLGSVILAVFGVVLYVFPNLSLVIKFGNLNIVEIPSPLNFLNGGVIRSTSITPNPVLYSSAVLYAIPLLVSMALLLSRNSSRFVDTRLLLFLALIVFLAGVVVFTSGSRSIFLISPIGFVLVLLIFKNYRQLLVSIILFVLITIPIVTFSSLFERIESIINLTDYSSFLNRVDAYKLSLDLFVRNWLVGIGLVNFKEYVPYYYGNYIHNIYLSVLVETGVLGFVSFVALISVALYKAFKNIFSGMSDYLKVGVFVSIVCFLIHGIIDNTLYVVSLGMMFWFFLGLCCSKNISTNEKLVEENTNNFDDTKN